METNGALVMKLFQQAKKDKLDWQPTPALSHFQLTLKTGSLKIAAIYDPEKEETDILFSVYNERGRLIDEFSDNDLANYLAKPDNSGNWYSICRYVFDTARRKALNAEKIMRKMIDELDLDDDIPF